MKKEKIYAQLSEEDRKALELGRKIMAEEEQEKAEAKVVHKKKRFKMYFGLAAVLILVMAVGITGIGGPERIVRMLKQAVGDREVEQVDSSDENLTFVEENEEEAYQIIWEKFGVEPVRITRREENLYFKRMDFDETLQTAELYYDYNGENVVYLINASYRDASWGVDVEDKIIDTSKKVISGCEVEVKEYKIEENDRERYSASFEYKGLEYFLVGTMNEKSFDIIINNLFFGK